MTIEDLREQNLIILECISGSKAYGLDTENSDTDIKGVFLASKESYYGLHYTPQISNSTNDITFYELGRFMELLATNNPNILELLSTPKHSIIYKHPFLEDIKPEMVLSKLCKSTFGKFALSQIKKAKGLKKKIINPVDKELKTILSFCYVNHENGSIPLNKFLENNSWIQENCGLINIPNMKDLYGLYYNPNALYNGIIKHAGSYDVSLSSIAKGAKQEGILYFNKDGYAAYCKDYKEYWEWVDNRNNERYATTAEHGKGYDAKNMMHVFRLLEMACEIGRDGKINVQRHDRDFLLNIKSGKFEYEELLKMADLKKLEMETAFENSPLPAKPDITLIEKLTFLIRDKFYSENIK